MIETKEEYLPNYDKDVQDFITAFKLIIYTGLGMTVISLIFGIVKGLLF